MQRYISFSRTQKDSKSDHLFTNHFVVQLEQLVGCVSVCLTR